MRAINLFFILKIMLFSACAQAAIKTSIIGEGFSLISKDYELSPKTFLFAGVHVRSDRSLSDSFNLDMSAKFVVGNSVLNYVNIRELYSKFRIGEQSELNVGRKLMNWSAIDNIWNLGVIQPQFKWNPLNPQNQGLFANMV